MAAHPLCRGRTHGCGRAGVVQQLADGGSERPQVERIVKQHTTDTVLDLVLNAPKPAGDDGACLPHRLGDSQSEAFRHALLHDDVGASLQSVHHCRVLLEVLHRQ